MTDQNVPRISRMHGKNFGQAAFRYNEWSADLDENQTLEDALQPRFWVDQASTLMGFDKVNPKGRGDLIHIRKLDTGLYAKLLVVEIGAGYVKTVVVERAEAPSVALPEASPLEWKWNAGRKAFDVIRKDGFVLSSGHQTKAAAKAWIDDHTKAMAA